MSESWYHRLSLLLKDGIIINVMVIVKIEIESQIKNSQDIKKVY